MWVETLPMDLQQNVTSLLYYSWPIGWRLLVLKIHVNLLLDCDLRSRNIWALQSALNCRSNTVHRRSSRSSLASLSHLSYSKQSFFTPSFTSIWFFIAVASFSSSWVAAPEECSSRASLRALLFCLERILPSTLCIFKVFFIFTPLALISTVSAGLCWIHHKEYDFGQHVWNLWLRGWPDNNRVSSLSKSWDTPYDSQFATVSTFRIPSCFRSRVVFYGPAFCVFRMILSKDESTLCRCWPGTGGGSLISMLVCLRVVRQPFFCNVALLSFFSKGSQGALNLVSLRFRLTGVPNASGQPVRNFLALYLTNRVSLG